MEGKIEKGNKAKVTADAVAKVKAHIKAQSLEVAKVFTQAEADVNSQVRIPEDTLSHAAKLLNLSLPEKLIVETSSAEEVAKNLDIRNKVIEKVVENFYLNFAINQYSLSQILYGDETFYKSKEDQTKRIQIATATGDTLLVDDNHGIPRDSKVMVVEDLIRVVDEDLRNIPAEAYRADYEASDAEGFMLPEFYDKISRAYGQEAMTDIVMKPVYFSIQNGIPVAIKYSVKVLTNELVDKFPHLATYRDAMRERGADQMVFKSAVKIGGLKGMAKLDQKTGEIISTSVNSENFLTLNTANLRFQLNPAHDPDVSTANPSQITAQINTNGQNPNESFELANLNAALLNSGLRSVQSDLRLSDKGTPTESTARQLRETIIRYGESSNNADDVVRLLQSSDPVTFDKVDLSLPLIAGRVVSTIASMISSATVGFKFKGSKLVLQADLGIQSIYDSASGKMMKRKLNYRDSEGYCEVILPRMYENHMQLGDKLVPGLQNGVVGFRIPSTNYHSMLPLKVVGFYDAPSGAKANVVIAPSAIVYYHGSDYDVDSLFIMRKSQFKDKNPKGTITPTVDLNTILSKYSDKHIINSELVITADSVVGFKGTNPAKADPVTVDGLFLHEYLEGKVIEMSNHTAALSRTLLTAKTPKEKSAITTQLTTAKDDMSVIEDVIQQSIKNSIVDLYTTNMLDVKNRTDLLTPISFENVKGLRSVTKEKLLELLKDANFQTDLQNAGIIQKICQ